MPIESPKTSLLKRAWSATSQLFGSLGNQTLPFNSGGKGFIPVDDRGNTVNFSGQEVSWLGLRNVLMQKYAYDNCYAIAAVADRLAELDTNGVVEILRATGKGKNDYATGSWAMQMNKLFSQPNPLQSWSQFRGQQVMYKKIFGFCPVLPLVPTGFTEAVSMVNIPPWCFDVEYNNVYTNVADINEIVSRYVITILGKTSYVEASKIILLEESFMQNESKGFVLPQSKLVGLDMAVSNLCAAMEADNVLLKKKGPLGFIAHDSAATKDSVVGYLPMSGEEKDELQGALQQYGLGLDQYQYAISRTAAKWNPMSYDVRQLGTTETITKSEKQICHRLGYPYVLFEETEAVYANGNLAAKSVYQDNVIPNANKDYQKYNKHFKTAENNACICVDYTHLPILQEDDKLKAETKKAINEALGLEYENNLITLNMWRQALGYDTVSGDDFYKRDVNITTAIVDPLPIII